MYLQHALLFTIQKLAITRRCPMCVAAGKVKYLDAIKPVISQESMHNYHLICVMVLVKVKKWSYIENRINLNVTDL